MEVVQAIEGTLLEHRLCGYQRWDRWTEAFEHFENRCEPVNHLKDGYDDIYAEVAEEMNGQLCEECQTYSPLDCHRCGQECYKKVEEKMNESFLAPLATPTVDQEGPFSPLEVPAST